MTHLEDCLGQEEEKKVRLGNSLTLLCLQDLCNQQNLNINTAANLLIILHQAINGPYEKYYSNDYLIQIKKFETNYFKIYSITFM